MKLHRMDLPREVVVGRGAMELLSDVCKSLGFSKSALVVTGPATFHIAGRRAVEMLKESGLKVSCSIVSSSTVDDVNSVEKAIDALRPEVVLGVGGGTKIDIAKLASARMNVPFISVPTTASHDGIASPMASVKGLEKPYSIKARSPIAIVADTSVIANVERRFLASGCGDVLAKLTAVRDWKLAREAKGEYYGEYAASLALMSAELVMKNAESIKPDDEEGVRVLLEALISCGVAMSIAGSSRPCSGSEHLFGHTLGLVAKGPFMHGEACGVGTIMMAYLHRLEWERVKEALSKAGAPTTARELGVDEERIIEALVKARTIRPERYTILDEVKLDYESARELARATEVIM